MAADFKIRKIRAREILDSRGNPTVEVDVVTDSGLFRASAPSGASTGIHEAVELRDNDESRFHGKGVLNAVKNVNDIIAKELVGMDCTKQGDIDRLMVELDGTENKARLGANATTAVSMAVCKSGASCLDMPLYAYIGKLSGSRAVTLPVPMMNVINGGRHAGIDDDTQEHMIMPVGAGDFHEALRMCAEVFHVLKKMIKKKFGALSIQLGDEGGFVPPLKSMDERLEIIGRAIDEMGYGKEFAFAIDCASSEFYHDGKYMIRGKEYSSGELVDFYMDLSRKFNLVSIEDGMAEDDWDGWVELLRKAGKRVQIVGDDLLVTNVRRIEKAVGLKAADCLLLKVNQIGTLSEALDAFRLASKSGWKTVVSQRSGCTEENFYADLVVGIDAGQFKHGGPARSDRNAKYNQLLRIEEMLGEKSKYARLDFGR